MRNSFGDMSGEEKDGKRSGICYENRLGNFVILPEYYYICTTDVILCNENSSILIRHCLVDKIFITL